MPVRAVLAAPDRWVPGALALAADGMGTVAAFGVEARESGVPRARAAATERWFAVPGLRNAHTHLDLSLVRDVPRPEGGGRGFTAWVLDLLRCRGPFDPTTFQRGAAAGAREALASGTTAVGDIDSSGAAASVVAAAGLRGVSFREVLGAGDAARGEAAVEAWVRGFPAFAPGRLAPGVSPHAPYSTATDLYRGLAAGARRFNVPLATHIAETPDEVDYVRGGGGAFAGLLARLGARPPFAAPPGTTPLRYLDRLGLLETLGPRLLLIHANLLDADEVARIAAAGATVAFCPRSHAFFGHGRHPVRELLDRGVRVALGTDSRASNASLSILEEMAYLRAARPDLRPAEILGMATIAGAEFLEPGMGSGLLEPGAPADFFVAEAAGDLPRDATAAADLVTTGALRVVATYVSGSVCHVAADAAPFLLPLTRLRGGLLSADSGPGPSVAGTRSASASGDTRSTA